MNVVLRTDVRGTLEALNAALHELSTDEVKVRVISSGVGAITESDVILAESSKLYCWASTFVLIQLLVRRVTKTVSIFVTTASSMN